MSSSGFVLMLVWFPKEQRGYGHMFRQAGLTFHLTTSDTAASRRSQRYSHRLSSNGASSETNRSVQLRQECCFAYAMQSAGSSCNASRTA